MRDPYSIHTRDFEGRSSAWDPWIGSRSQVGLGVRERGLAFTVYDLCPGS